MQKLDYLRKKRSQDIGYYDNKTHKVDAIMPTKIKLKQKLSRMHTDLYYLF